jgi:hypothetical protein
VSSVPQPGDACQWEEYDAEVLSFDEEQGVVWIVVYSGEPFDIRAIAYRPDDWQ